MLSGRIDSVVFDLGGVLIDWNPRHVYRRLFADDDEMEHFLASVCTDAWHRQHDLGADIRESCQRLADVHPGYRDMIMAWADHGEEMAAGQFDETVDLLRDLKAAGLRCYALSNMEPDAFAIRYERFSFMKLFDGCVISGIEGVAKPDRRIFEILLERFALDPATTVFVDDSSQNVDAARRLGINALRYTSAARLRHEMRTLLPQFGQNARQVAPKVGHVISAVHLILYVRDRPAATAFWGAVLDRQPFLDDPGMTEFALGTDVVLGLMPEDGIKALLGSSLPDPGAARGVPRAEVYLVVPDAADCHARALAAGATELSPLTRRSWGDDVAYSLDPDGHVIAFAATPHR